MMESDETFFFSSFSPVFYILLNNLLFFSFAPLFAFLLIQYSSFILLLQTEMPTKAPGQGRSSTRSDAEESEIGHSSARRRVHRRGREVSVCAAPNSLLPYSLLAICRRLKTSASTTNIIHPPGYLTRLNLTPINYTCEWICGNLDTQSFVYVRVFRCRAPN